MKKLSIILFFSIIFNSHSFGQYYFYDDNYYDKDLLWEVGVSAGKMLGITDVGAKRGADLSPASYNWAYSRLNTGVYAAMMYKNIMGVRLELTQGSIGGNDNSSNSAWVKNRNLNFKSRITEVSLTGTFYPLLLANYEVVPRLSPYLAAGIAYFSFYPKTFYNGQWISLSPLRTEGQNFTEYRDRKQYNLTQMAIPFGAGLKYEISPLYNFRIEALYRYTFTDYLDDVSTTYADPALFSKYLKPEDAILAATLSDRSISHISSGDVGSARGNAANKDGYLTINIKFGLVIGRKKIRG